MEGEGGKSKVFTEEEELIIKKHIVTVCSVFRRCEDYLLDWLVI